MVSDINSRLTNVAVFADPARAADVHQSEVNSVVWFPLTEVNYPTKIVLDNE